MRRRDFLKAVAVSALSDAGDRAKRQAQDAADDQGSESGEYRSDLDDGANGAGTWLQRLRCAGGSGRQLRAETADGRGVVDRGRRQILRVKLREGLKFHDGEPVRSNDCIASISRWSKRDVVGQAVAAVTDAMEVIDDRSFRVRLKTPFPRCSTRLAK